MSEQKKGYMPKSKSDNWATPSDLYAKLDGEFHFDFDPCPIDWEVGKNPDGLSIPWGRCSFVNPPYSNVAKWIEKAHFEWKQGKKVVMLINAITDTKAFHTYIYGQATIRFIQGRIKFVSPDLNKNNTPNVRPSMLVIFD